MKQFLIISLFALLLIGFAKSTNAQNIFDYEQKIELSEDLVSQEVEFTNLEDGVVLSGSLIYPTKGFNKVVIIVPGSGKDTRHSHFVLAEEFLSNQIAVYRFDERGVGKSGGRYDQTASCLENDVIYAFKKLESLEILSNKEIGILGHSLGGIASIGAFGEGCDFDFLIQISTPVENNGAFLKYQVSTNIVGFYTVKGKTTDEVIDFVDIVRKAARPEDDYKTTQKKVKAIIKQRGFRKGRHIINRPIVDLMKQNHEETYKTSDAPILFIIGSEDRLVSYRDEISVLERMNNQNITISLISDGDHYLNDTNQPIEQSKTYYHMADEALYEIINWTLEQ